MSLPEHAKYKYLLHLDGTSGSNRLLKLLLMGSVVLKQETKRFKMTTRDLTESEGICYEYKLRSKEGLILSIVFLSHLVLNVWFFPEQSLRSMKLWRIPFLRSTSTKI